MLRSSSPAATHVSAWRRRSPAGGEPRRRTGATGSRSARPAAASRGAGQRATCSATSSRCGAPARHPRPVGEFGARAERRPHPRGLRRGRGAAASPLVAARGGTRRPEPASTASLYGNFVSSSAGRGRRNVLLLAPGSPSRARRGRARPHAASCVGHVGQDGQRRARPRATSTSSCAGTGALRDPEPALARLGPLQLSRCRQALELAGDAGRRSSARGRVVEALRRGLSERRPAIASVRRRSRSRADRRGPRSISARPTAAARERSAVHARRSVHRSRDSVAPGRRGRASRGGIAGQLPVQAGVRAGAPSSAGSEDSRHGRSAGCSSVVDVAATFVEALVGGDHRQQLLELPPR